MKISFTLLQGLLHQLKNDQLVFYRGGGVMGDYEYQLTEMGRERARRLSEHCSYFGSAPVTLADYIASVASQSLTRQHPTAEDLHNAFHDLLLDKKMLDRLGPAINSGRGLFLYGAAGNGSKPLDIAVAGNGRFLYAADPGNGSVDMFRITHDGGLTNLGTVNGGLALFAQGIAAR